ncbi:hypothetical protein BOTNAR_0116g00090 [Botryotinia narcissicola]|uniref:2EXR domain-containing protein n=1 Tax=Botryotinia narcissicola TaxID=278944 RepID=A0A4Z1IS15_9HELO|nr:hypothetical protein BOTNAR_0116g00090 [Botryotinia narcissicola]
MTHQVVDGFDSGYLDPDSMRLQLQNEGFPVVDKMLHHNQMHDSGFQVDVNMFSQDHMADGGYHIDENMISQNHMNNGEYAIGDDFEMTDAQTIDGIVPADGTFSSHEENRVHVADNDIEMSDEGMMDEGMMNGDISADNATSPQGEDGENKVGDDADDNAIVAAPAPNDHMNQCRIMFLAFNPPPTVQIDPSQRNLLQTAPIEIRHMIYELWLPGPRTVSFDLINSPRGSRQREYEFKIPAIFQVDSDSRAFWNMKYITVYKPQCGAMIKFYGTRNPMPLIFNPKIDTASITFLNKRPQWVYNESKAWLRYVHNLLPNGLLACVRFLDMREVSTEGPSLVDSDLQACFFPAQVWNDEFWKMFGGVEKLYFTASNVGNQWKRMLKEPDFARFKDFVLSYRASGVALGIQNPIPANNVVVRSFVPA